LASVESHAGDRAYLGFSAFGDMPYDRARFSIPLLNR
jgi:hypothetical protein